MPPGLVLRPNENIMHPTPCEETQTYPLVITTFRTVTYEPAFRTFENTMLTFQGPKVSRPFLPWAVIFAIPCIIFAILGIPKYIRFKKKPDKPDPALQLAVDKFNAPEGGDKKEKGPKRKPQKKLMTKEEAAANKALDDAKVVAENNKAYNKTKTKYLIYSIIAAVCGLLTYLSFKAKKYQVMIVAGPGNVMEADVKDEQEQKQVLTMLQSAKNTALMMAGMAPPPAA